MASQNTTLFASQLDPAGQGQVNVLDGGGRQITISDTYLTTSAVTAGTQNIALCKLPNGAKVNSLELIVPASVGTSSAKIGYGTISGGVVTVVDDDRWGSAVNLSTAGRKQFVLVAADADYVTTSEVAVVLTPVTTDFATAITFQFIIGYTTA